MCANGKYVYYFNRTEVCSQQQNKTKQLSSLICEERSGQTVGAAAAAGPGTVHWRGL